jgi:hypothetical protein
VKRRKKNFHSSWRKAQSRRVKKYSGGAGSHVVANYVNEKVPEIDANRDIFLLSLGLGEIFFIVDLPRHLSRKPNSLESRFGFLESLTDLKGRTEVRQFVEKKKARKVGKS